MKKSLVIFIVLFILASIPLVVYLVNQRQEIRKKAAPATTLSFSPETASKEIGETFSLDIIVDPGENSIAAAELYVIFDPTKLKGLTIEGTTYFPNVFLSPPITGGIASITLGSPMDEPMDEQGIIATILFEAKAATVGTTKVELTANCEVGGIGEQGNVLIENGRTPALITVLAVQATPTPTPSPTVTTTPGATATPTVTTTPGATSTPEATSTPTSSSEEEPAATNTPTPTPEMPDSGIVFPTIFLILAGLLSLSLGSLAILH
jgi:cell division septation protein DedD